MYVAHLAKSGQAYSSLRHNLFAIAKVHMAAGAGRPDRDDRVRVMLRGIGRSIGTRAEGANPLGTEDLARIVGSLGSSVRDIRDRAMLLVGFAGAYRSSDLATLNVEHVRLTTDGMDLLLVRSKDDQMGLGRRTHIPANTHPTLCPVRALRAWLERSSHRTGPLFRVIKGVQVLSARIHPRAVSRALQRAASIAGIAEVHYTSHSLRRGFATAAHAQGSTLREIQVHGRWTYMSSLARYIDLPEPEQSGRVVSRVLQPVCETTLP
jgi:integrase